jgi:hypothetical protein
MAAVSKTDDGLVDALLTSIVDVDNPRILRLLIDLQQLHDRSAAEHWPGGLARLAEQYGLSTAVLDAFPAGD